MRIEVVGSGCPSCKKMYELVSQVVTDGLIDVPVKYVSGTEGVQRILELGAVSSPLLAIDGKVVLVGFSPDKQRIRTIIEQHTGKQ